MTQQPQRGETARVLPRRRLGADVKAIEALIKKMNLATDVSKAVGTYKAAEIEPRPNRPARHRPAAVLRRDDVAGGRPHADSDVAVEESAAFVFNATWLLVARRLLRSRCGSARRGGIDLPRPRRRFFYLLVLVFLFQSLTRDVVNLPVDFLGTLPPWAYLTPRPPHGQLARSTTSCCRSCRGRIRCARAGARSTSRSGTTCPAPAIR